MQSENERIVADLMEQLIGSGPDRMAAALNAPMNLAKRIGRERHLGARVPPPVPETLVCAYAAMGWPSSWSRLNRAGERWPCRSISQCSL